ncbi:MAG: murein L,D-transpeptidase catalytic domain family protein [Elusimicrobiales bacterium]
MRIAYYAVLSLFAASAAYAENAADFRPPQGQSAQQEDSRLGTAIGGAAQIGNTDSEPAPPSRADDAGVSVSGLGAALSGAGFDQGGSVGGRDGGSPPQASMSEAQEEQPPRPDVDILPDDPDKEGSEKGPPNNSELLKKFAVPNYSGAEKKKVLAKYSKIDAKKAVPQNLLEQTLLYYNHNKERLTSGAKDSGAKDSAEKDSAAKPGSATAPDTTQAGDILKKAGQISGGGFSFNTDYVTVVDFTKHSSKARFFIIDMKSGAVKALHVAHGSGSDPGNTGYATKFSNQDGSHMSSLGFYLTGETYTGNHGRSMRLDGLSPTNSNVRARAVVVHGSSYVQEASVQPGRSWGCLALSDKVVQGVIDKLKKDDKKNGGSIIYAGQSGKY